MVFIGDISYQTRKAWAALAFAMNWEDLDEGDKTWLTLDHAASLFFRLRHQLDTADVFPKGKWASIQLLETLIDKAVATQGNDV